MRVGTFRIYARRLGVLRRRLPNYRVITGMPLIPEFRATGPQIRLMLAAGDAIDPDRTMPDQELYLKLAAWGKANRALIKAAR